MIKCFRIPFLIIILGLFVCYQCTNEKIIPITTPSEKAKTLYLDAMRSFCGFNTSNFLRLTHDAIKEDPGFFMANYQLAMYFIPMGYNNSEFRKYAEIAVNSKAKLSKGELLLKECMSNLIKKRQHNVIITTSKPVNIAQGVINNGLIENFPEVTNNAKRLVNMYPDDINAYFQLFAFQELFNDLEGQVVTLNTALKITKEPAFYYWKLGYAYMYLEKYSEALIAFDKYIEYAPDNPNFYYSKGDYYMKIKDFKDAYESYMKAYELDSLWSHEKAKNAKELWLTTIVDIDRNAYKIVKIGNQIWTNRNLDVEHYRNGDTIPQVKDPSDWGKMETGAWCYYDNDPRNGEVYGKLYNWYAVNDPRGLTPSGTHIPSDKEWTVLTTFLGGLKVAGWELKSRKGLYDPKNDIDNVVFKGLPGGHRLQNGRFDPAGYYYCWWSSTEFSTEDALCRFIFDPGQYVEETVYSKGSGMSVRCIKDK